MRLFRMELYKLFYRKIFIIGVLTTIGLMVAYFWIAEVDSEISVIEGHVYSGYEAIQSNRRITKEFEGTITDEKIHQIINKYGLPEKFEENMPGWRDGNYLTDFVTRYFTDGSWETRTLITETYPLEETDFGKICGKKDITPCLDYTMGWKVFLEMLQFGLVLGSVLIICGVSVVFAEEDQTKMLPLIFTTEEGRNKDIVAKTLASFTLAIIIFLLIVSLDLVLCGLVYGLDGYGNVAGIVLLKKILGTAYRFSFSTYMWSILGFGFLALLSVCAITLCISAHQKNSFSSVVISAACWGLPVLLRMFFGGFMWLIVDSTPVFLIMSESFNDIYVIWYVILAINLMISVICLIKGTVYYKRRQVA